MVMMVVVMAHLGSAPVVMAVVMMVMVTVLRLHQQTGVARFRAVKQAELLAGVRDRLKEFGERSRMQ